MRIVIFGQKWLAVEVLRQLLLLPRATVVGVCLSIGCYLYMNRSRARQQA